MNIKDSLFILGKKKRKERENDMMERQNVERWEDNLSHSRHPLSDISRQSLLLSSTTTQ